MDPRAAQPEITVVVPVFNAVEFLEVAVASVLASTTRSTLEVICVDDGSGDGSLALMRRLAASDQRVRVLPLEQNQGASAARNAGIEHARGEYVFFLDADDAVPPGALDHLLSAARSRECDVAIGQLLWFKSESDCLAAAGINQPVAPGAVVVESFGQSAFLQSVPGCHCCNLYSRRLLNEHHIRYATDLTFGEDQLFQATAMLSAGRVAVLDEVVYVYHHYRGQSLTRRPPALKNLLDDIEFQCRIARVFARGGLADAGLRFLGAWSYSIRQYWLQIPVALTRDEAGAFFAAFRAMAAEFAVQPWNQSTPAHHRHLLGLILAGEDDQAIAFLAGDEARLGMAAPSMVPTAITDGNP